jgi:hypothetical protein
MMTVGRSSITPVKHQSAGCQPVQRIAAGVVTDSKLATPMLSFGDLQR